MWDPFVDVRVREMESDEFQVVSVYLDDSTDFHRSLQFIFARRLGASAWLPVYAAEPGRWFTHVQLLGFPEAHRLRRSGNRHEGEHETVDLRQVLAAADVVPKEVKLMQ